MTLTAEFYLDERDSWPKRKLAEAAIVFGDDTGPLAGLKLVGFTLWRDAESDERFYVTFPARAFGSGGERRYFDFLRTVDGNSRGAAIHLKNWLAKQARAQGIS